MGCAAAVPVEERPKAMVVGGKTLLQSARDKHSSCQDGIDDAHVEAGVPDQERLERHDLLNTIQEHYAVLEELGDDAQMPVGLNKANTIVLRQQWQLIQQNNQAYGGMCRQ